jgi:predicted RNA-binding Zn-ribbon protein involved in translation (DUF1610 family)
MRNKRWAVNTEFVVEFQCPQCGAPASLEESSRLFICEYCHVKSYLVPRDVFRYVLPSRAPENKEIIYYPYWRYKGVLFVCMPSYTVHGEVINKILQAAPSGFFPFDLGFKAQVMKIRFTGGDIKGRVFYPIIPFKDALEYFKDHYPDYYHSEFIGSLDLIYAPFYVHDDTLYDAISNCRVGTYRDEPIIVTEALITELPPVGHLQQDVKFIPTLCPNCGWDMDCARDSYLLVCKNCSSFYKPGWEGLKRMGVAYLPGDRNTALYLPFWRIRAEMTGIKLNSYEDLIKIANLVKFLGEDCAQKKFYFWIPGFRIDSHLFLKIAKNVTVSQPQESLERSVPDAPAYPVNLPIPEVVKTLKTVFAGFVGFPEVNYPKLEEIVIRPKRLALIYLPFQVMGSEFIHPKYKVRVTKKTLEHFRLS